MKAIVGYTGFVGSNIYASGEFDAAFNSKNIEEAYGSRPELLVYAGLRAEKFLANNDPQKDLEQVMQAEENIRKIAPRKLILISTIDVFKKPKDVDENSEIDKEGLHPYGYNRYILEERIREEYPECLIVRLPGLFGKNIKKNFIYDMINLIPSMLKEEKLEEIVKKDPEIGKYYHKQENGFYKVEAAEKERFLLRKKFGKVGFSALNFTDSRSRFQFYDLGRLWEDIKLTDKNGIRLWHPATEPVSAAEVYEYVYGKEFKNELAAAPADYDYKTIHSGLFGRSDGYISGKEEILRDIKEFVERNLKTES